MQAHPAPSAALIVLDGWGVAPAGPGNAISLATTPVLDRLCSAYPHVRLEASGRAVGLPEHQMGNSEVGHLSLGAGAVLLQDLTRINDAVRDGQLAENEVLRHALSAAERVHLIGLVSDGGVHSGFKHLEALIRLGAKLGVRDLVLHAFTDGRDTLPTSGAGYLEAVEAWMADAGAGRIGSVVGRYLAMDRYRRWDRIQRAYDLLVHGRAEHRADSGGRGRARGVRARARRTSSSRRCWSVRRRVFAPATRWSRSTFARIGCARSPARSPSRGSPRSTAGGVAPVAALRHDDPLPGRFALSGGVCAGTSDDDTAGRARGGRAFDSSTSPRPRSTRM